MSRTPSPPVCSPPRFSWPPSLAPMAPASAATAGPTTAVGATDDRPAPPGRPRTRSRPQSSPPGWTRPSRRSAEQANIPGAVVWPVDAGQGKLRPRHRRRRHRHRPADVRRLLRADRQRDQDLHGHRAAGARRRRHGSGWTTPSPSTSTACRTVTGSPCATSPGCAAACSRTSPTPDFIHDLLSDPERTFTPREALAYGFKHANTFAPGDASSSTPTPTSSCWAW